MDKGEIWVIPYEALMAASPASPTNSPMTRKCQYAVAFSRSAKKALVEDFENAGREWRPQGQSEQVRVHDFIDDESGKVALTKDCE